MYVIARGLLKPLSVKASKRLYLATLCYRDALLAFYFLHDLYQKIAPMTEKKLSD